VVTVKSIRVFFKMNEDKEWRTIFSTEIIYSRDAGGRVDAGTMCTKKEKPRGTSLLHQVVASMHKANVYC